MAAFEACQLAGLLRPSQLSGLFIVAIGRVVIEGNMDNLSSVLNTLLLVGVVAALAPLIVALLPGPRVPQIVLLIIGGIMIGPQGFGLSDPAALTLIANIGLGLVFLLAGYELDPAVFGERAGRLALIGWVITAALAAGLVGVLAAIGFVHAFVPVALALTTTALGTLLPILRENNLLAGQFGRYIMAAGAVGELLPILGIAFFLSAQSQFVAILSVASVGVLALVLSLAPRLPRGRRIERIISEGEHSTSQITLRFSIVLLLFLLSVAATFGLDVVLGAFLAGMVLRRWAPTDPHALEEKLDAIGYGFFIPVFFVASGMNLDVHSIIEAPLRLLVFFVLLLVIRGLPGAVGLSQGPPHDAAPADRFSSPRRPCRCSSRSPRSGCGTGRCCPRTPPPWSVQACCR